MFSRPKILFLVSLLFVALLNPKFNPYLLFKFLIFYHSSIYIYIYVTLCVGGSKASAGQYILYCPATRVISRYCLEGSFQLSFDPPFDPTFHLLVTAIETSILYIVGLVTYLWY